MSQPGRPSRGGNGGSEGNNHIVMSAGRGAILVGLAVIVGLLVYAVVDDTHVSSKPSAATSATGATATTAPGAGPGGTTATTGGTTATTKAKTTTTTAKASDTKGARPNDQVVVQVLNGSEVSGAATTRSNDLKAKGYQTVPANNTTVRTGTAVQCRPDYSKEANVLVATLKDLGVTAVVEPLPNPVPANYDAAANCYVVLGK